MVASQMLFHNLKTSHQRVNLKNLMMILFITLNLKFTSQVALFNNDSTIKKDKDHNMQDIKSFKEENNLNTKKIEKENNNLTSSKKGIQNNSNKANNSSLQDDLINQPQKMFNNSDQAKINNIETSIFIDPVELSCDLKIIEKANFTFNPPTSIIYYTIISPRNPYYNFKAELVNKDLMYLESSLKIKSLEVYIDRSFKERTFIDKYNNNITFRDRWVVVVTLNKPVSEVEIQFSYFSERSILINQTQQSNLVKLTFFNPYNQIIFYDIGVKMSGFNNLTVNNLKLPWDSNIKEFTYKRGNKVFDNGIEVSTKRELEAFGQYELFMSLPMEIKTCDAGFVNVVYYSLIGVTALFTLASIFTVYHIYKE